MGLALGIEAAFRHHVAGVVEERLGLPALGFILVVIDVGRAGWISMASGAMASGALMYSGNSSRSNVPSPPRRGHWPRCRRRRWPGVAVLEYLGIIKNRPFPAVALVGGEGDQAGDAVFALDVLMGQHAIHAGHLFGFRGVDALMMAWETLAWARARCRVSGGMR